LALELNAHRLKAACPAHGDRDDIDTARLIGPLHPNRMFSNVGLGVRPVDLRDRHGMDDVISCLEANLAVPGERRERFISRPGGWSRTSQTPGGPQSPRRRISSARESPGKPSSHEVRLKGRW
jgi:hypothetical protein